MQTRKIRILFIIDGLYGGGKERQLVEIIKALNNQGNYALGVITFNRDKHYSCFAKENVSFFKEISKRPTRLEPLFLLWKQIFTFKPDIIHTWDGLSSFYSYGPCKILNIHFLNGSIRDSGIEKGWQRKLKRLMLLLADTVVSNSYTGLAAYKVKGEVIYNAIDIKRFRSDVDKGGEFNMVMVASFSNYKDHSTFVSASIRLMNEGFIDNVYLIGDGPNRSIIQFMLQTQHPELKNRFMFTGSVYNVEDYLQKCKVGVLCSTSKFSEGLSNSVLEYMASGLVPIVTNVGGNPEIIVNGANGFLVEPHDADEIYKVVVTLRHNEELIRSIIRNCQDTIRTKFDFECSIQKLMSIYKKAIK